MKSQYDQWLDAEKQKIHDKFIVEREKVNNAAFMTGFSYSYSNDRDRTKESEYADKMKVLDQQEETAINEFMTQIQGK
jgi:hypothetical protein